MLSRAWLLGLGLAVAGFAACGGGDAQKSGEPPVGWGVNDEEQLALMLFGYGMPSSQAECVARAAFAANPSTDTHADRSYDITQALFVAAGDECGVDWSDYDFTGD
jgi:hypothetical protein